MSKFRGRGKRWRKSLRRARWKTYKKERLANGWVEVAENCLVPKGQADDYPPFIPTHLGGKAEKGRNVKLENHTRDLPNRSIMRGVKKNAKKMGISVRQYMFGEWPLLDPF